MQSTQRRQTQTQRLLYLAIVCAVTFALAYVCLMLPRDAERVSPVWLPNAVILGLLLRSRRSQWRGLVVAGGLGALLANLAIHVQPPVAVALALCNALESIACAVVLVRWLGRTPDMLRVGNLCRYALVAAAASLVSAVLATTLLNGFEYAAWFPDVATWALADFAGLAIVTPCIVVLAADASMWRRISVGHIWPLAVLLVAVLSTFLQDRYPSTYLVVAALLLVAWRLPLAGAAAGVLATLGIAVACTVLDRGTFAFIDGSVAERMLALQAFLAVCFYLSLPIAAQRARGGALRDALAQALAKTQEAEARFRLIAERAQDIIVRGDLTGRILYVSPSCRTLGYEPEELIGSTGAELVHPDDLARFTENTAQLIRDGVVDHVLTRQHRFRRKDGGYVWLEGRPTVLVDEAGRPLELLNVFRDITERKQVEIELAAKDAELETLTSHAPDLLVRIDTDDRIVYASPACRQFGYEPEELVGRLRRDLVHPEDLERLGRSLAARQQGAEPTQSERQYRILRSDGSWTWVEGSLSFVRSADGAVVGAVSLLRDIGQRRAAAEALAESEARYRLLTDNMTDIVACYDRDGVLRFLSPAVKAILGYEASELVGRSIVGLMHPDDVEPSRQAFRDHFGAGPGAPPFRFEYRLFHKDGTMVWLEAQPRATYDPDTGEFLEWQDTVRDFTQHKALEEQLKMARAEAEASAQVKTDFLANMSHELRTPLTSVVGFTKLALEQPELQPLTRTYVERVSEASRALLSAVNDILDFSKLEAGQVTFRPEPVAIGRLARSALDLFQPQAGAKDLHLTFEGDLPDDLALMLDPDRTRQVLLNLIGNAVKFTESGGVTLRVGYDEVAGALTVAVKDTGAGIPEDRLDRLFKRFSQVDGSLTRSHGGTGLGLAICKGIVEAMGGSIAVTSTMGEGSCFSFTAPVARAVPVGDDISGQAVAPVAFGGLRVLVADDHPANRELVRLFLAGVGAVVSEAENGAEAADLAAQEPFDVILMDLRMPTLDGPGALQRIRSEGGPNQTIPILAFTADADPEMEARLLALGFEGVVSKPVSPAELISAIAQATAFAEAEMNIPSRTAS